MDQVQKKILVVEDDQFLREFYQELLTGEGFWVDIAGDGELGLNKIQSVELDLVLLDIMMPKKDGVQVLKDLKSIGAKSSGVPIVILTNLGQDTVIKQCFDLGAEGYLIKSALNPEQVLIEIRTYLQKGS